MALYSIARRTTNGTTNQAAIELIAPSVIRPAIQELGVFIAVATASVFGFGRPAAAGVTPTSPVALLGEDSTAAAGTSSALAWATSPTNPTEFARRVGLSAAIGVGVIWTFPRGFRLPASATAVVQNIGATSVADIYAVVEE